jgi:galactose oxidase
MKMKRTPVRVVLGSLAAPALVLSFFVVITASVPGPSTTSATQKSGQVTVPLAAYTPDAPTLQREGWTASASQQAPGDPAESVLDSNAYTDWDAQTGSATPASITIDMRAPQVVSGLIYEPPQTPSPVGAIGRYEISVSSDDVNFTTVSTGTWSNTTAVKQIGFDAVDTRFVRLAALSTAAGVGTEVGAAEIYLQGSPHVQAAAASTKLAAQPATVSTNPAVVGEWGPTIGFPIIPVAAALLPNNEMLVWSADQALAYGGSNDPYTQTAILNLTTGAVSEDTVTNTDHNMFCPGVAILPDGEIMVTGGLSDQQTSIYNPATNTWRAGPQMNIGRGYQGMTLLSNGQAFTLGGSWSGVVGGKLGEIWSPTGSWRELTNVPATPMYTADAQGAYRADNHGWFIATSGGDVLQAGPSKQMNWIATTGAGSITPAGTRGTSGDAMNGNAVYYDTNKVITMGGAPDYQNSNATNQAYEIQIKAPGTDPTVTQVGSMNYPRAFANSVVLPNGQVVTMGGQTYAVPFSDANSILNAELWNPTTGTFTVMAPEAEPRNYHSVGILLPDGRVFSGGGGLCGTCSTNHPDGQIFTPPYLLNADGTLRTRPTITSAPTAAATGQTITVTTGGPVSQFSMVRYGESTHSVDNDQRRVPLSIVSSSGDTYQLAIPSDPGIALPGPYMLFAMDASGTPSVSTTISITNVATQPPSTNYGQTVYGDGPAAYWPLNEKGGATAADLSGNGDTANYLGGGFTYGVPSPVEGGGGQGVTLNGSTSQIVASQPITNPTDYSEEMWFKTTTTTGGTLMGFGTAASGTTSASRDRLVYMANNGQLYFAVYPGTSITINSPLSYNDGKWHQVIATQGPDGMHLYVDGQQVATNATTTGAQNYLGYWRVGAENLAGWSNSPTSNYFAGSVSDVAFYNSELSSGQVLTHYQAASVSCLSSWSCSDIGGALPPGQQTVTGSTWSVSGGGDDIWGTADAFHFVDQTMAADGTVTAHVTAQSNTSPWAKAGVMLRATTDPGSPYYAAFVTPANGVVVQWRTAQGASTAQVATPGTTPTYLRVGRYTAAGNVYYTAYTSPNGTTWTMVPGSTQILTGLSGTLRAGLAVTSHNQGTSSTVGFDTVSVTATEFPPPGYSCPTGWTCTDIGSPLPLGQQTSTGGAWSLLGGGGDIWATADSFHFVSQTLAADGSISAQVTAQADTSAWAKAGVMLRATTDPGSPYYAAFVTPANSAVVQWRTAQGGTTTQVKSAGTVPVYLKVDRTGSSFTAYTSPDGSSWTAVPGSTVTLANLGGTVLRGLAVTSHNQGTGGTVAVGTVTMVG